MAVQAVILAGGGGTRLKTVTGELPKPLVEVVGVPLLGRQLSLIRTNGLRDVLILCGYGAQAIADYVGDGSAWGLSVRCLTESVSRGTAGAVYDAMPHLASNFLVVYGDTAMDVDLERFISFHLKRGADATLFLHPNDHPYDSDLVELAGDDRVLRFHPYPHSPGAELPNLVNAALYVIERDALLGLNDLPAKPDFGKDVFPAMLAAGRQLIGYRSPEYIKDVGTPERHAKVCRDIASGRAARISLRQAVPAVFLDRDGVLNEERNLISRPEDLQLLPGAAEAVKELNGSDYRTVVVTNQPVLARGDTDEAGLRRIHARLDSELGRLGAYVDALYYCPHHPHAGFPGEVPHLKIVCNCRKPATGMIDQAAEALNLDLGRSWLVGDTSSDIEAAHRAGLISILVGTGHGGRDSRYSTPPDFVACDLADAVRFILSVYPRIIGTAERLAAGIGKGEVVAVAGAACSERSSLASAVAVALRRRGLKAVVVPLDRWMRGPATRALEVVRHNNLAAIDAAIDRLVTRHEALIIPSYDTPAGHSQAGCIRLQATEETIVIVEGVSALMAPGLRDLARHRWFINYPRVESERCLGSEYRSVESDDAIAALQGPLGVDEIRTVNDSRAFADTAITIDDLGS